MLLQVRDLSRLRTWVSAAPRSRHEWDERNSASGSADEHDDAARQLDATRNCAGYEDRRRVWVTVGPRFASRWDMTVAVVVALGMLLAIALPHVDGDREGIGGVLRFREDGADVTVLGSAILVLFVGTTSLGAGACASPRGSGLAAAAALLAKLTLVVAVVFMFVFPDLSQFEAKSLTWRAILCIPRRSHRREHRSRSATAPRSGRRPSLRPSTLSRLGPCILGPNRARRSGK